MHQAPIAGAARQAVGLPCLAAPLGLDQQLNVGADELGVFFSLNGLLPGNLAPGEISESAQLAGLVQTKAERLGEWQGSCLVARGNTKK